MLLFQLTTFLFLFLNVIDSNAQIQKDKGVFDYQNQYEL